MKKNTNWSVGDAKIGFAKSRRDVIALVRAFLAKRHGMAITEVKITLEWWTSSCKQHLEFILCTGSRIAYCRVVA